MNCTNISRTYRDSEFYYRLPRKAKSRWGDGEDVVAPPPLININWLSLAPIFFQWIFALVSKLKPRKRFQSRSMLSQIFQPSSNNEDLVQPSFKTTEFIPYFLNYIREESSCHFTSDLPVISPKKIKKKRRLPRHRTPTSDTSNDSTKSSARGSLFSTPPSGKGGNMMMSPIGRVQARNTTSPVANHHSGHSSDSNERSKVPHVTSTPVKFNIDEDFPPVGSQNISAR